MSMKNSVPGTGAAPLHGTEFFIDKYAPVVLSHDLAGATTLGSEDYVLKPVVHAAAEAAASEAIAWPDAEAGGEPEAMGPRTVAVAATYGAAAATDAVASGVPEAPIWRADGKTVGPKTSQNPALFTLPHPLGAVNP